jgi:hypothetical protein
MRGRTKLNKTISRLVVTGAVALLLPLGLATATASAAPAVTSCHYTANANNINIRTSPDGPASGYKLQRGFYWLSDPLKYSSVKGGQHWVYGENTGIHGWVGGHYLDYSGSNNACKAPL